MGSALSAGWLETAGVWVGFAVTLLIFSALFGDHLLARAAQMVLVGAVLGYAVVVVWQSILGLELVVALRADPWGAPWQWTPVALAAIMALAGLERIFAQGRGQPASHGWRAALRTIGAIPALGLVALGVAVAIVGAVQGTLAPQFLYAAQSSFTWDAAPAEFAAGLLTLLLASAALLFFVLDPAHHLAHQPAWVQRLMGGWLWIGQRAVWVAAGALFARLFAARLALLIAELSGWLWRFQLTGLGDLFASWWRMVTGA